MIVLYSNHCPCCEVLRARLDDAGVAYTVNSDTEEMLRQGITHLPMLLWIEELNVKNGIGRI